MRTVVQTHPSNYPRRTPLHNQQETGLLDIAQLASTLAALTQEPLGTSNARKMWTNRTQRFKLAQNSNIINKIS